MKRAIVLGFLTAALLQASAWAQDTVPSKPSDSRIWELHFQSTIIGQGDPSFPAEYSGANSMNPRGEVKDTVSVDVTGRVRLWHGGEFCADFLAWQGYGLSNTLGAASFPNGEAFRIGRTYPDATIARAYLRETINLGREDASSGNTAAPGAGPNWPTLTFTVGHFSAIDTFDSNAYAGDPRTQFMNWSLLTNTAWDYPANTLGFTNGAAVEWKVRSWAARYGIFQVSRVANGMRLDWDLARAWSMAAEAERQYSPRGHAGAARFLAYLEHAHMGSYQETINNPSLAANIMLTRAYRSKYGFGLNLEQEIHKDLGAFVRLGWSDGKNELWEFTDVDRTASAGLSLKGARWRRPEDTVGLGAVINGISAAHRQFLAAGGLGITVGDGALNYRSERLGEAYYNWKVAKHFNLTLDYQYAKNPAYNHARGPIHIFATRLHTEF